MLFQTLTDGWSIRPLEQFQQGNYADDDAGWLPATVPAHWQQHPELADHTGKVAYRCGFALRRQEQGEDREQDGEPVCPPSRYWLRVNGAFYWSQPYLNGHDLGRHEGYFDPYEHEITALVQPEENRLLIEVDCPEERNKLGKQMITGVFSHWDCLDPQANPGGIWLPVEVHASGPAHLQSVRCHSETIDEQLAQVRYTVDLDTATPGPLLFRWTFAPRTFDSPPQIIEQHHTLKAGPQSVGGLLKLHNPCLWWSHDLGRPDLYTLSLELVTNAGISDRTSFAFGVRRFELRNWIPYLNGVRFFIKGSNYAPGDMRIATMNAERAAEDMRLARGCHMNFLRVHAHVDHPALYDAADAAGILLWQDMPLQWLYRPTIIPEAQRQARAMVQLLSNHPSVVVWCMHNEPIFVADTSDETLLTRMRTYFSFFAFSWNRDVLDTRLKRTVQREDPERPAVRSSGEFALPFLRAGTDSHAYYGWYSAYGPLPLFEKLRSWGKNNLRFVTEFGAQSFPNVESCAKFMPTDLRQIDVAHLARRHSFQPDIMSKWIDWRKAQSLPELVEMTQNYQIFIHRYYVDRLRYHKYRPTGGIVPFMFCDSFPAILWSVLDYWRVPKRSYHALRLAFSPQYAFTLFFPRTYRVGEPIVFPLYVVNDAHETIPDVHLVARLCGPGGAELASIRHRLTLPPDSLAREVDRLRLVPETSGTYTLELELRGLTEDLQQTYEVDVAK